MKISKRYSGNRCSSRLENLACGSIEDHIANEDTTPGNFDGTIDLLHKCPMFILIIMNIHPSCVSTFVLATFCGESRSFTPERASPLLNCVSSCTPFVNASSNLAFLPSLTVLSLWCHLL